jgi:hypothetical protein
MRKLTLSVSFYGPFVFYFDNTYVKVHAPKCDGHLASVQTNDNEQGMQGTPKSKSEGFDYLLREQNPKGNDFGAKKASGTGVYNGKNILKVDRSRMKTPCPHSGDCYYRLELPRPHYVVGLIADPISYIEYDLKEPVNNKHCKRATALRFHYYNISEDRRFEVIQMAKSGTSSEEKGVIEVPMITPESENYAPLSFRYSSNSLFDSDHTDAERCFGEMRSLFPPLGAWAVKFDEPQDAHASDCKAAQIVFLTTDELNQWNKLSIPEQP